MGDRANVFVKQEPCGIYLYTHWRGEDLPETVRRALLRGRDRWSDEPYLTRIIFAEMIRDSVDETTGYGISTQIGDNQHGRPVIVVDAETQHVYGTPEDDEGARSSRPIPFREFVELPTATWADFAKEEA